MTKAYTSIFNSMKRNPPFQGNGIFLNKGLLAQACISAVIDLDRHAVFHDIEIADRHKQAAFTFAWLSKLRPVKPVNDQGNLLIHELCANAYFAIHCANRYLHLSTDDLFAGAEIDYIVYSSIYRDIHPESWGITFCLLEKQYPAKGIG